MKRKSASKSAFFNPRVLIGFALCLVGVLLALLGFGAYAAASALAQGPGSQAAQHGDVQAVASYHNDTSAPLRDMLPSPVPVEPSSGHEANENPKVPNNHIDSPDPAVQGSFISALGLLMPSPILNFDGIPFPGVNCNCAPPDPNGAVGKTQFVQIVNEGYQVFDKSTGNSVLGPNSISSIWSGFGGACENGGSGDPVVLYDHLANRWIITQFATATGGFPITDECVAVSTTSDATGTYNRYGFHLGSNFFDYPKLSVWPDAYYMSMNVFNSSGTSYLGPQPFAFDRSQMLAGMPASFVSPGITNGPTESPYLPADLDGSILPAAGSPNSFVEWPATGNYKVYHFHVDFAVPANSTFTLFVNPAAAGFTQLCQSTRSCVPQLGSSSGLDALGDRLMFRAADRFFPDGHESLVANYTVSSGGVAGIRWFELRSVTSGPVTVFQESTYQPDTTWRWMGSAAMDKRGNLVVGFSASSSAIFPQLRYAGRLASDPPNTLNQGEALLFAGTGSQTDTGNRWGDYSSVSIDPVDDTTFWYTNEYYASTSSFNWRTRIGSFRFPGLIGAVSRKTHGSAGTFDVDLPLSGRRGVECRVGGGTTGDHTIVFTFSNNLNAVGSAGVTCGSVSSSAIGPNPNQYTVNLTGENACNQQYVTITLTGVVDSSGAAFNAAATMGLLLGDTTANGLVNSSDISQTQSQSGQPVTSSNFREDVNTNGLINSTDVSIVQSKSGTGLPTPP